MHDDTPSFKLMLDSPAYRTPPSFEGFAKASRQSRGLVLIATSNLDSQHYLETVLSCQGYSIFLAETEEELRRALDTPQEFAILVADHDLSARAVQESRKRGGQPPVILLVGDNPFRDMDAAAEGSSAALQKPVYHDDLSRTILEVCGRSSVLTPAHAKEKKPSFFAEASLTPQSRMLLQMVESASQSDVPVLVQGETGAGKEVIVREIHRRSRRNGRPFVSVNCAALPRELVESQLFGYERGAFTGAICNQPGLFEVADGGTIFLDEIGDMDIRLQAKLLQVLQDQEFHPLGSATPVRVDVRVMAATHRDLRAAMANGNIRADLYYRLNVMSIQVLPLRERRNEILPLAEFFLRKHSSPDKDIPALSADVRNLLVSYHWPGNVRELENMIRRYLVLRDRRIFDELQPQVSEKPTLVPAPSDAAASVFESLDRAKRRAQSEALLAALSATQWNRKKAADLLKVDYKQLLYQMKKFQLGGTKRDASGASLSGLDELVAGGQVS